MRPSSTIGIGVPRHKNDQPDQGFSFSMPNHQLRRRGVDASGSSAVNGRQLTLAEYLDELDGSDGGQDGEQ